MYIHTHTHTHIYIYIRAETKRFIFENVSTYCFCQFNFPICYIYNYCNQKYKWWLVDFCLFFFFFYLGFLSQPFTNHRTAGKGEGIFLIPHYHFNPLNRHLDIGRAITAESSPLHIGSSRTRTWNFWFLSASR